jgi:Spy/CpxP family protein refolding chaperone
LKIFLKFFEIFFTEKLSKGCKEKKMSITNVKEANMKKAKTLLVIFSVLVFCVASSYAQPRQRILRSNRMLDRSPARILVVLKANQEKLGITNEQIKNIEDLGFAFREKMVKMKNDNNLLRLEMQKLMQDKDSRDYEKIKAVLSRTADNRHEIFIEKLKLKENIQNILTEEQKEVLKAMAKDRIKKRMPRVRDRMQRFPRLRRPIKDQ